MRLTVRTCVVTVAIVVASATGCQHAPPVTPTPEELTFARELPVFEAVMGDRVRGRMQVSASGCFRSAAIKTIAGWRLRDHVYRCGAEGFRDRADDSAIRNFDLRSHDTTPHWIPAISASGWRPTSNYYAVEFSHVGFNDSGTQAIVYRGFNCPSTCGEGRTFLLRKVQGQWIVVGWLMDWVG